MERIVKGIFIPMEIWQATDLSWSEKILLMEIDSFTTNGRDCFFSNDYIAELLNVKPNTASVIVSSLIKKGYVKMTRFDGRHRYLETCVDINQPLKKIKGRVLEKSKADFEKNQRQTLKKIKHTNTNTISVTNTINESKERFTPPTLEEVKDYAKERGFTDPAGFAKIFIDYYTQSGWHLASGRPMKDWRKAVITWEPNNKFRSFSKAQDKSAISGNYLGDSFTKYYE